MLPSNKSLREKKFKRVVLPMVNEACYILDENCGKSRTGGPRINF